MAWEKYADSKYWHESANLFPLIEDKAELQNLADDIERHGLQNPIVLFEGKVLDGRNRARACKLAGVEPRFTTWHQNGIGPSQYVVSQNLSRRHLTYDQRAGSALKLRKLLAAEAKNRKGGRPKNGHKPSALARPVSGKSAALAARDFGIGTRNLEDLIAVEKVKKDLAEQLIFGKAKVRTILSEWAVNGKKAQPRKTLAEKFGAPQFTVLDAKQGYWQNQKRAWEMLGLKGENGRGNHRSQPQDLGAKKNLPGTSVFDPVLAELMYRWFCPAKGRVLDPFAGESVKGIVAAKLGFEYTGIELRSKQVRENRKQAKRIGVNPTWYCGSSTNLSKFVPETKAFDLILTSPPYWNLEEYRGGREDLSSASTYATFLQRYKEICRQSIARLKPNRFCIVKVGDFRDRKTDFYCNFLADNLLLFRELGLQIYNIAVLAMPIGSAAGKSAKAFTHYRKLTTVHQYVLCFFNGKDCDFIPNELGVLKA